MAARKKKRKKAKSKKSRKSKRKYSGATPSQIRRFKAGKKRLAREIFG